MNERQSEIFKIITRIPRVSVKELSKSLQVSEVTIRKDLSFLEDEKLVKRTHGGAVQITSDSIEERILFRYDEKLKLAREAAKLIEDGETVLIESGATNAVLAKEIINKSKVHVITNCLYIAELLKDKGNVKVTMLGGELQEESQAVVGPLTRLCLSVVTVNKAFIGMDGFSEKLGFTCSDFLRAEVGREMSSRAEKVIILAEASKFQHIGVTPIVELSSVNTLITDKGLDKDKLELLKKNNINVLVV